MLPFCYILIAGLALVSTPSSASKLTCRWQEKNQCEPKAGCRAVSPSAVYASIDLKSRKFKRCDKSGCDEYDAKVSKSGAFTVIDITGRGVFVKVGPNGQATEVVSVGNSVLISHGTCR